jgi:hypothetical protein
MIAVLGLKLILWTAVFAVICLVVGKSVPSRWLFPKLSRPLQEILVGLSLLVVAFRLPLREELPINIGGVLVAVLGVIGSARIVADLRNGPIAAPPDWRKLGLRTLALLPAALIMFLPLTVHAVFFQNHGPDLDGHLLSASFVLDGHTAARLFKSYHDVTGSYAWWDVRNVAWTHPDFREAVAIEVFIRSLRYGHAITSSIVAWLSGEHVWFGLFVTMGMSFLLTPLMIVDGCLARGCKPSVGVAMALAITSSQTYALMLYEGIVAQLIMMPVLIFATLNYRTLLFQPTSLGQKLVVSLILSGLLSTFGDGFIVLGAFAVVVFLLYYTVGDGRPGLEPTPLFAFATVAGLVIALSPAVAADFVLWVLVRAKEDFIGGALQFAWPILPILSAIPYVTVPPTRDLSLIFHATFLSRLIEIAILLAIGAFTLRRMKAAAFDVLVVAGVLLGFTLTRHDYVVWKGASILAPLALISVFQLLPERFVTARRDWVLFALVGISVIGLLTLLRDYRRYAERVHPGQFAIDTSHMPKGESFALVTPSQSRVYLKVGSEMELNWANDGWRPNFLTPDFSIGGASTLKIALYYDCDAEGPKRCAQIKQVTAGRLPPRTLIPTGVPISSLLDSSGHVSVPAMDKFIRARYGADRANANPAG